MNGLPLVVVFAKAPVPGHVKSRLTPPLDADSACSLHRAFVEDTLTALQELNGRFDIELHTDRNLPGWQPCGVIQRLQSSGDLGHRMMTALSSALQVDRPLAVILGSDSPTLPIGHISALLASPADVCLGPTADGGFYAIACRRTHPAMFAGVAWSTADARSQTTQACQRAGLSVAEAPAWYDIDVEQDLTRLIADPWLRSCTLQALIEVGLLPSAGST